MARYKVTTSWTTYSHYIVEAINVDDAETKFKDFHFVGHKDDPTYGDNDEVILTIQSMKDEDTL